MGEHHGHGRSSSKLLATKVGVSQNFPPVGFSSEDLGGEDLRSVPRYGLRVPADPSPQHTGPNASAGDMGRVQMRKAIGCIYAVVVWR